MTRPYRLSEIRPDSVTPGKEPGVKLGVITEDFSHGYDHQRFSFNINGTIRTANMLCVEMDVDELGATLTMENCVADFVG
jgi:hypothetical protein